MTDIVVAERPDPGPSAPVRLPGVRARPPAERADASSPCPSPGRPLVTADARAAQRRGRRAAGRGRRRRSWPPGRCPRGPRTTTRSPSSRRPSASARRSTRRRAGTRCPPASRSPASASSRRWSCWPRWSAGRRSRTPRWSGCATSGSTTSSRRGPIRAGAPKRRSSTTIYTADSPYHRPSAGSNRPSRRWTRPRSGPPANGAWTRRRPTLVVGGDLTGLDVAGDGRAALRRLDHGGRRAAPGRDHRPARRRHPARAARPSAGLGPDRDPDRPPRAAPPDPRLPRRVGHERRSWAACSTRG